MTANKNEAVGYAVSNLNDLLIELNRINDEYPRHVGTMVMVSDDTENMIEGVLVNIQSNLDVLHEATDAEIEAAIVDMNAAEYREWMNEVHEVVMNNYEEVAKAREFLARYYSR